MIPASIEGEFPRINKQPNQTGFPVKKPNQTFRSCTLAFIKPFKFEVSVCTCFIPFQIFRLNDADKFERFFKYKNSDLYVPYRHNEDRRSAEAFHTGASSLLQHPAPACCEVSRGFISKDISSLGSLPTASETA